MSSEPESDKLATILAEEVLRKIYGDDYAGCAVAPHEIAALINEVLKRELGQVPELIDLYEKVVEAVNLLSTPPDVTQITDPNTLRTLLGERWDAIHAVSKKTMETTAKVKARQRGEQEPGEG